MFFFHCTHVNPEALGLLREVEQEIPLDDAGCGEKVHARLKSRKLVLSRVSTYDSRPLVSDA